MDGKGMNGRLLSCDRRFKQVQQLQLTWHPSRVRVLTRDQTSHGAKGDRKALLAASRNDPCLPSRPNFFVEENSGCQHPFYKFVLYCSSCYGFVRIVIYHRRLFSFIFRSFRSHRKVILYHFVDSHLDAKWLLPRLTMSPLQVSYLKISPQPRTCDSCHLE